VLIDGQQRGGLHHLLIKVILIFFFFFKRLSPFPSPSFSLFLPLCSGTPLIEALSLLKKEGLRERGTAGEREKERGRERENG
jgi:hypothetical protein